MTGRTDNDSPVGLLMISADDATIAEWHPRQVEVLRRQALGLTEAEEHELVGPSYSHPRGAGEKATGARSSAQRDLWERRLEDHRARFARAAADSAARSARTRGWDVVLVLGDPRRTAPATEELARKGIDAVRRACSRLPGSRIDAQLINFLARCSMAESSLGLANQKR